MNLENTCYIVGAASLDGVRLSPRAGDYVIAADGGYRSLKARGIEPDFVMGDFDSLGYRPDHPNVETHPVMKDDTDLGLAVRWALADAGFDQPSGSLTASAASGSTTLLFGRTTNDGNSYYVRLNGDETTAYILPGTLYQLMSRPIYDMMELPELPVLAEDRLLSVTIQGPDEEDGTVGRVTVLTAYQGEEGTSWRGDGANITDAPVVRALLEDFAALTITKCVDYHPSDDAAALCGFDNPAAKVSIRYTTETDAEQTLQLTIGSRLPDETGRYVQLGDDSTIYFLPTELLDPLMAVSVKGLEG